ncbi:MAG: putative ferredoxin reductase [Microbacteriaceae bacterium]|nr:putative ferredoxin reductase [Microbacteriaceae bacterium]
MVESVVIVGASLGGIRAAEALRRSAFSGAITVIGDEAHLPYNRPPLSKHFLASQIELEAIFFPRRSLVSDVSWHVGTRITSADFDEQTLTSAHSDTYSYDSLIIATGLRPKRLRIPGSELWGCFALRTLDDAVELRSALTPESRVVVVGSGFIGCEVAATVRSLGCEVTVIGRDEFPMQRPLGTELAAELMRRNEDHGIRFRMLTRVKQILGEDRVTGVALDDGTTMECNVVVEAVGSQQNTEWLRGNDIDADQGILTDSAMRVLRRDGQAWKNVFAVGDVARFPNKLFGDEASTVEHWNIPTETAKRAAEIIAAGVVGPEALELALSRRFAPIPSFWSDQFDAHLLAYGMLGRADRIKLVHGRVSTECIFGYFHGETLVGVCGIGNRSMVMHYRDQLAQQSGSNGSDPAPFLLTSSRADTPKARQ